MSAKLRPEDLTSEERALWDETYRHRLGRGHGPKVSSQEASEVVLARRALFAPAPENVAKAATTADRIAADLAAGTFRGVKPEPEKACQSYCPHCDAPGVDHYDQRGFYTCHPSEQQPATPEPAAPEMPEALAFACSQLRQVGLLATVEKIKHYWRNLAQPVAVGMTEELEHVLSIAERDLRYKEECFDNSARTVHDERIERLRAAIAAVREQFGRK